MKELPVKKTVTQLADGRELIYYDAGDAETRAAFADQRPLEPVDTTSETRLDPVQREWVAVAAHRQGRPYLPPTNSCPHGQIYAFPYLPPKTARAVDSAAAHRKRTGRNLFDDVLAAERAGGRVVLANEEWTAFVPFAARWPYEVHLYPNRRVGDFTKLDDAQRATFPGVYLELLGRFDRLFTGRSAPTPYIAAWHQAPVAPTGTRPELALHLE